MIVEWQSIKIAQQTLHDYGRSHSLAHANITFTRKRKKRKEKKLWTRFYSMQPHFVVFIPYYRQATSTVTDRFLITRFLSCQILALLLLCKVFFKKNTTVHCSMTDCRLHVKWIKIKFGLDTSENENHFLAINESWTGDYRNYVSHFSLYLVFGFNCAATLQLRIWVSNSNSTL